MLSLLSVDTIIYTIISLRLHLREGTSASPRRAGRSRRWWRAWRWVRGESAGARHLLDLPEGYHAAARGQAWVGDRQYRRGVPPSGGVIGLRQVEEMALRHSGWGSGAFPERTPYPHPACVDTR